MSSRPLTLLLAVVILLAVAGCDEVRPIADAPPGPGGAAGEACTRCHGDASRAEIDALVKSAPPVSVKGGDGGPHLAHLRGGAVRGPLACDACHAVPTSTRHADGVIDVAFGPLASARGATPSWNGTTCATYCHGASLDAGGQATQPAWTTGVSVSCQSCHGYPPPSHAPTSTRCASCHPGTVKADGSIEIALGNHIDGEVDVNGVHPEGWREPAQHGRGANADLALCRSCHGADLAGGDTGISCNTCHAQAGFPSWQSNCTFCHGATQPTYAAADLPRAAPPTGTRGETGTDTRAVGAHQRHLAGGALARGIACAECHASVPTNLAHVDGTARVEFGPAARRGGASPTWNGTTCATYCHGQTLAAGGTRTTPAWTGGPSQAACGTCHGAPPPAPHPTGTACGSCHTGYTQTTVNLAQHVNGTVDVSATSCTSCHGAPPPPPHTASTACGSCHTGYTQTTVNDATHRNGRVDVVAMSCTSCHGDAARAANKAAPPVGTRGETARTALAVGAHAKHLDGTLWSNPVACTECHVVPTSNTHADGAAQVTFGPRARTGNRTPTWTRTSATCSSTYCHGAFTGTTPAPTWTSTTAMTCASCHRPQSGSSWSGRHSLHVSSERIACSTCHGSGYSATAAPKATHLDGVRNVTSNVGWNATTRSCANSCHGSESW